MNKPLDSSAITLNGAEAAVEMLAALFQHYLRHHREIGELSQRRARRDGWRRAVCDYLAGMTDRYVQLEHQRIFGLKE